MSKSVTQQFKSTHRSEIFVVTVEYNWSLLKDYHQLTVNINGEHVAHIPTMRQLWKGHETELSDGRSIQIRNRNRFRIFVDGEDISERNWNLNANINRALGNPVQTVKGASNNLMLICALVVVSILFSPNDNSGLSGLPLVLLFAGFISAFLSRTLGLVGFSSMIIAYIIITGNTFTSLISELNAPPTESGWNHQRLKVA